MIIYFDLGASFSKHSNAAFGDLESDDICMAAMDAFENGQDTMQGKFLKFFTLKL